MRILLILCVVISLTACTPEKFGAWLRTQSGAVKEVSQQAQDAAALATMQLEAAKKKADEAASRARQIQEGVGKIVEGQEQVRQGLEGLKQSSSSSL